MHLISLSAIHDDPIEVTPEQWDTFRALLKQKYVDENLKLKEVEQYMLQNHGVRASTGQYQRMFKKWNFRKNFKRKDCEEIIVNAKRRRVDLGNIELVGAPSHEQDKFRRALRRCDLPGLQYTRPLEFRSTKLNACDTTTTQNSPKQVRSCHLLNTSRDKPIQISKPTKPTTHTVKSTPFKDLIEQIRIAILKLLEQGLLFKSETTENIVKYLLARLNTNSFQEQKIHVLLENKNLNPLERVAALLVYQLFNGLLVGSNLVMVLVAMVKNNATDVIRLILTSKLQPAKAVSKNILRALFGHQFQVQDAQRSLVIQLLGEMQELARDPDFYITASQMMAFDISHPRFHTLNLTLLQSALLQLDSRPVLQILDLGADVALCASHGRMNMDIRVSCCATAPINVLAELTLMESYEQKDRVKELWHAMQSHKPICPSDMCLAAFTRHPDILKSLLDLEIAADNLPRSLGLSVHGREIWRDRPWLTALQYSVGSSSFESVSILLRAGASPSGISCDRVFNHFLGHDFSNMPDIRNDLDLETATKRYLRSYHSMPPLSIAIMKGDIDMARLLLHHKANIDGCQLDPSCLRYTSTKFSQFYHCICADNHHHIASPTAEDIFDHFDSIFLPHKDGNSGDKRWLKNHFKLLNEPELEENNPLLGFSPLQVAVTTSSISTTKFLLEQGADVHSCHGLTPLSLAICNSDEQMVKLLLEHHASPNGFTMYGPCVTPLAVAAYFDNVAIMKILVEAGAKITPYMLGNALIGVDFWQAAKRGKATNAFRFLCHELYKDI